MWRHGTEEMGKPEADRHHGRTARRYGDDIKSVLRNNDIILWTLFMWLGIRT